MGHSEFSELGFGLPGWLETVHHAAQHACPLRSPQSGR